MVPEEHVYTNDSKEGYFMKTAEENKYRDVVINEDVCSTEKAITREFVVCLKKHQLAIQFVLLLQQFRSRVSERKKVKKQFTSRNRKNNFT